MTRMAWFAWMAMACTALLVLTACVGGPGPLVESGAADAGAEPAAASPVTGADRPFRADPAVSLSRLLGRNDRVLVVMPGEDDSAADLAAKWLGQRSLGWRITEANAAVPAAAAPEWRPRAGTPVVVPLAARHPQGVTPDGVLAVPILCYHRFGTPTSKMVVSPAQFEAQLDWLASQGYTVLRLSELAEFLAGRRAVPQRSVVITIDDGYESAYRVAFPALKKHGFAATLFVTSDFVGARDAVSWAQLVELAGSGLIDIQAHSKTHRNLAQRGAEVDDALRPAALERELRQPRQLLEQHLAPAGAKVRHFAYPYGDADAAVLDAMQREGYELGLTVNPGGNPFFAHPLLLRRTMVFGDHDLAAFQARLRIARTR